MSIVVSCGALKVLKRRRVTWLEKKGKPHMSHCGRSLVDKNKETIKERGIKK